MIEEREMQIESKIEQYMFERGEYEYKGDERIRWLDENNNRAVTTRNLHNAILANETALIIGYLESEIATACEEDADRAVALVQKLRQLVEEEKKEYEVLITEISRMKVIVEASSRAEAEEIAFENWNNGEYIIDANYFEDVQFDAMEKEGRDYGC